MSETMDKTPEHKPDMRQCNKCAAMFDANTIPGAVHLASCKVYNGHKNYETWAVSLWLDNDEGSYNYWREAARECMKEALADRNPILKGLNLTLESRTRYRLAERLKEEIRGGGDSMLEEAGQESSMYADLLGAAFDEVAWHDIAEGYMEDIDFDAEQKAWDESPGESDEDEDSDEE